MDLKDKVLGALKSAGTPLKSGEIADLAGLDKKEVDKAIKSLKEDEKVISPKRCYYQAK